MIATAWIARAPDPASIPHVHPSDPSTALRRLIGTVLVATGLLAAALSASPGTASAAPPMPRGYYQGTVTTFAPGNLVWYGKSFTGNRVINNTAIGWSFPGAVYPGRSVQNGEPVIVVDYRGTAVGFIRDELRSDGRGGYWGRSLNGGTEVLRFHLAKR